MASSKRGRGEDSAKDEEIASLREQVADGWREINRLEAIITRLVAKNKRLELQLDERQQALDRFDAKLDALAKQVGRMLRRARQFRSVPS